ncbi:MAG: NUDIX domain-containing protein [Promethearchaeota archaeon]
MKYKSPKTTIDAIILDKNKSIVLIKRKIFPYQNYWALPGGFVKLGERVEDAVIRETQEETGLDIEILKLVGVYSDPDRDPRGHTITIAYLCRNRGGTPKGGTDAKEAKVFSIDEIPNLQLAFDHNIILQDALKLADQEKLW